MVTICVECGKIYTAKNIDFETCSEDCWEKHYCHPPEIVHFEELTLD